MKTKITISFSCLLLVTLVALYLASTAFTQKLQQDTLAQLDVEQTIMTTLEPALDNTQIKTVAVWQINAAPLANQTHLNDFLDNLFIALMGAGKYRIIDRKNLELLLQEQKFSQSDLFDPAHMKEFGKLSGVDAFLYGDIREVYGRYTMSLKLLNVTTARAIWATELAISAGDKSLQELAIEQAVAAAIDSLRAAAPTLTKTQTVSVWKILKDSNPDIIAMDKLNIALIQENIFEVVDRENLESLLTEQKLSLTGLVDPEKMKELGQIYGVDAFIFGTERTEAGKTVLALQMIDVDTATVIWGEEAGKTGVERYSRAEPTEPLDKIAYAATNSLAQAQKLKVNTIAIGNLIGAPPELSEKLSIRLTKLGRFKVIDRSRLDLILKEQKLSLTGIIAPEKMKELGKLYGIDAFIFGRLSKTDEKTVTLVLKLLSVDTGELLWISKSITDFDFESIFGFGSMVQIPAGWFLMGSREGEGFSEEHPPHKVWVDAFLIDRYEVTNAQYEKFMKATGHEAPAYGDDDRFNKFNHPVVGVSWFDAVAYAKWAGKRLPTEAEWEKAARGGLVDKRYPWGDDISYDNANYEGTGGRDRWEFTSPVGNFPPNGYGLYDMAGNVFEWVADWYDEYYYRDSPERNPKGPNTGERRVLRGGSWCYPTLYLRCALRSYFAPLYSLNPLGFRCSQDF